MLRALSRRHKCVLPNTSFGKPRDRLDSRCGQCPPGSITAVDGTDCAPCGTQR